MPAPYWPQTALLHDHLDGSRPLITILPYLHKLSNKKYPFNPNACHHEQIKKWFKDPQRDIVEKFSVTTGVMQSRDTLRLAAQTYVQVRARQGFKYCEATIAPQYHTFGGLTEKEVVAALIEGIQNGEKEFPNIEVNILFTVGREVSSEEAVRLVNVAGECDRDYVVGIGLVCDEAAHPPEKHIQMFRQARELGFKTTCHAGEWCDLPPDKPNWEKDRAQLLKNIRTAIYDLGVDRIGHAIPLSYDSELLESVLRYGIGIEGCPGSNMTSELIPNTKYLNIRKLLELGVIYSLNPDDDLLHPDMNEVFQMCNDEYRFTEEETQKLLLNPWLSRFGKRKNHLEHLLKKS